MDILIVDPGNKLSVPQKKKIRAFYREDPFHNEAVEMKENMLNAIFYPEGVVPYKDVQIVEVKANNVMLSFSDQKSHDSMSSTASSSTSSKLSPRDQLRQKLRDKLRNRTLQRSNSYKDEAWRLYHTLLNHPAIRSLPDETIRKALPNPDDVRKNADAYRMMNAVNPNPALKEYFNACLEGPSSPSSTTASAPPSLETATTIT